MKKNFIALMLAAAFSMSACSGGNNNNLTEEDFNVKQFPENEFVVMADLPPIHNDYQLELYKDAGFNTYIMTEDYVSATENIDEYFAAVDMIGEKGLDVFIRGYDGSACPTYFERFFGKNFLDHSAIKGIYMIDEPSISMFRDIADFYVPWYNEHYTDLYWHLNLFPSYAGSAILGIPQDPGDTRSSYEYYIDEYCENILSKVKGPKDISLDHYPLRTRNNENYLSNMWLYDLMVVANAAKKTNSDFTVCIQSFDGGYRLPQSSADIKFQIYTSMAFGASMFEFFCYSSSMALNFNALVTNGRPTDVYYYVKEANAEIQQLAAAFKSFKWTGVATVNGSENGGNDGFDVIQDKVLKTVPGVKEITASADCLVGCFEEAGGMKSYMIVNYGEPTDNINNTVKITFDDADGLEVYRYGVRTVYPINKNTAEIPLGAGEGVFVIPLERKTK